MDVGPPSKKCAWMGLGTDILAEGWGLGEGPLRGFREAAHLSSGSGNPCPSSRPFPEAQAGEEEGKYTACFLFPPEFHSSFGFCFYSLVPIGSLLRVGLPIRINFRGAQPASSMTLNPASPGPPLPLLIGFLSFVSGFQALSVSTSWTR